MKKVISFKFNLLNGEGYESELKTSYVSQDLFERFHTYCGLGREASAINIVNDEFNFYRINRSINITGSSIPCSIVKGYIGVSLHLNICISKNKFVSPLIYSTHTEAIYDPIIKKDMLVQAFNILSDSDEKTNSH